MMRTGPRGGGIGDLMDCRNAGQAKFEDQMSRVLEREKYNRAKLLHTRAMTARAKTPQMRDRTTDIGANGRQAWAKAQSRGARTARREARARELHVEGMTAEEADAMERLSRCDQAVYAQYQEKRRPIEDMDVFLQQREIRTRGLRPAAVA
jgi:hypothetical protein